MKHQKLLLIPVFSLTVISPAVFSQDNELDITIRVMNENEQPSDFVQRLELPSPETFGITTQSETNNSLTLEEEISGISDDITGTANASEEISINTIIDNISINGAGAEATVDNANNLPDQVVDILDENLPLNIDLSDRIDETTGEIVDVTDDIDVGGVDDLTGEISEELGDVSNNVDDTTGDIADEAVENTDDMTGDIVDTVDDLDSPADSMDDTLGETGETGDLTTDLDELSQPLDEPIADDNLDIPQELTNGL
jgi:ABC-type antimicrobial peptide transport system permease subunit